MHEISESRGGRQVRDPVDAMKYYMITGVRIEDRKRMEMARCYSTTNSGYARPNENVRLIVQNADNDRDILREFHGNHDFSRDVSTTPLPQSVLSLLFPSLAIGGFSCRRRKKGKLNLEVFDADFDLRHKMTET